MPELLPDPVPDPGKEILPTTEPTGLRKRTWYRTTLFNAFVIGTVGFMAPGLWNALNSLGAGGAREPYLINAANALVFGLMAIFCFLGAPIANRLGLAWTLVLGAIGYPVYSAGLYCNNRFGNVWFVIVGAAACGISAGLFWASEGAIALGYPEPEKRGRYMNIWLWFRTGGPLVGGAIVLALNNSEDHRDRGAVGYETYLVFIALQCLAVPVALVLTPPEKVERKDGSQVLVRGEKSIKAEMVALWRASRKREVLLLLPVFLAAYFNQYHNNFQAIYFGVRARALIGFVSNFGTLASSQVMSTWLDYKRFSVKQRIHIGFWYVVVIHIVAWVYGWVIQEKYTRIVPAYDYTDRGFTEGFFVLLLWDFSRQALQNWLYYFLSTATDNMSELTRYCGILRGQESLGQCVAFGLNTQKWPGGRVPLGVNTILLGLAVVPTWWVMKDHVPVTERDSSDKHSAAAESDDKERKPSGDAGSQADVTHEVQAPNKVAS